jgi:hypothetical protein
LKAPKSEIAVNIIAVRPAAGPETLNCEVLKYPTTIPPTIPEIIPENNGAPEAKAILNKEEEPLKKLLILKRSRF